MPKPRVDLDIALAAIDTDLDAMGEEIATVAGQQTQLSEDLRMARSEIQDVKHAVDTLLDQLRVRVFPVLDEIAPLRRRIVALEDGTAKHPLDAE